MTPRSQQFFNLEENDNITCGICGNPMGCIGDKLYCVVCGKIEDEIVDMEDEYK